LEPWNKSSCSKFANLATKILKFQNFEYEVIGTLLIGNWVQNVAHLKISLLRVRTSISYITQRMKQWFSEAGRWNSTLTIKNLVGFTKNSQNLMNVCFLFIYFCRQFSLKALSSLFPPGIHPRLLSSFSFKNTFFLSFLYFHMSKELYVVSKRWCAIYQINTVPETNIQFTRNVSQNVIFFSFVYLILRKA
jgi:hypothetical protein